MASGFWGKLSGKWEVYQYPTIWTLKAKWESENYVESGISGKLSGKWEQYPPIRTPCIIDQLRPA